MRKAFFAASVALLCGALLGAPTQAEDEPKKVVATVGKAAPDFTLKTLDGKDVSLADVLKQKKIVVLEWFNSGCPFVVKHHKRNRTMADLYKKHKDKVVWLAINSSAKGKQGHGLELNKAKKAEWKIDYPILLDSDGKVGRTYGARTTPHMYVIDAKGVLQYAGAIDNNRSARKLGDVNYVDKAITALVAGKPVETSTTKPYGCRVKY